MSRFEDELNTLLSGSSLSTQPTVTRTKTASPTVVTPETEGLRKLATVLRNTKVDPTYQELYSFVEGVIR